MSFQRRLVISLVLLLLPLIASEGYLLYRQYLRERTRAKTDQLHAAQQLGMSAEVFVSRMVAIDTSVGQALINSHWHSIAARHDYIASIDRLVPGVRGLALADEHGKIIESSPKTSIGVDVSKTAYFDEIRSGKDWAVSDLLVSDVFSEPTVVISTGIRDRAGKLLGVAFSGIEERELRGVLHIAPSEATTLVLFDAMGHVIFMSGKSDLSNMYSNWSKDKYVRQALSNQSVYVPTLQKDSMPPLTGAITPVPGLHWAAGSFVPTPVVYGPLKASVRRDLAIILMVLAATMIIGAVVSRQMTSPITHLSEIAERLGRGDLSARAEKLSIEELAALSVTMNQMADSVQRAYERELRIATVMQERMLPKTPERIGSLEIATGYFPALKESELGGDFYDVIVLGNDLVGIVIADVSGKGLAAAVDTAMVRYMLEAIASINAQPGLMLSRLNRAVSIFKKTEDIDKFVTLFLGIVNTLTGDVTYANAGHPPPLIRRTDGSLEWLLGPPGLPLGVMDDAEFSEYSTSLSRGDTIVLYTDGVVEAHQDGNWFDSQELEDLVGSTDARAQELIGQIYEEVSEKVGGKVPDDVSIVVITRTEYVDAADAA